MASRTEESSESAEERTSPASPDEHHSKRPRDDESDESVTVLERGTCGTDFLERLVDVDDEVNEASLAIDIGKKWPTEQDLHFTVGFIDPSPPALDKQKLIVEYMNKWSAYCPASFELLQGTIADRMKARVRVTLSPKSPHWKANTPRLSNWSYVGTDISHPTLVGQPTMALENIVAVAEQCKLQGLPDEYERVVCHEAGHTLGFVHEHSRKEIIDLLDKNACYAHYAKPPNNWSPKDVDDQILTPLPATSLRYTASPDPQSIMCYDFDAALTKSKTAILGGHTITKLDGEFAATEYPKSTPP
eukprot:m.100438 g.100438  ORF g.100438 m.100438 type:complete len:303 (-) comp8755_c0_seq1:104-1012(-)